MGNLQSLTKSPLFIVGVAICSLVFFGFALFGGLVNMLDNQKNEAATTGTANVSAQVEKYRPLVEKYAKQYKCSQYVDLMLALMMQESGGRGGDPMQASESLGLPPNSLNNPKKSIQQGVKTFSSVIKKAHGDIKLAIQSYNFGSGFISYVDKHGGKYTKELAISFSQMEYRKLAATGNYTCVRPESAALQACYGDIGYVDAVMKYYEGDTASVLADAKGVFKKVMKTALKYEGRAYVFGGSSPSSGFDCSGLTKYVYGKAGIKLPRTAQQQYDAMASHFKSEKKAKPGDLIFFTGTYSSGTYITHVGIYVGSGKFYGANGSGVGYASFTSGYWKNHFASFGKIGGTNN